MSDVLHRWHFANAPVRGSIVRLDDGWQRWLESVDYSPTVQDLLGRVLAALPLLTATMKFEGRLNIQFQGAGDVSLLVGQCTNQLKMRGMIKAKDNIQAEVPYDLLGDGTLALMIEGLRQQDRYQAIVERRGESLAKDLEHYFQQSEQLPTRMWLFASETAVAGMLLQRMPGADGEEDAELWDNIQVLADTITPEELLELAPEDVRHRLFHQEDVHLHAEQAVDLVCECASTTSRLVVNLGREDAEALLQEQGGISIDCGFCGRHYHYAPQEVRDLLDAAEQTPSSPVQ